MNKCVIPIRKELLEKRRELLILQKGETLDEDRLDSLLSEIVRLQCRLEKYKKELTSEIKAVDEIIKEEQQKK